MKILINKNQIDAKTLEFPLSKFVDNPEFVVTAVKDNFAYENEKRTDKWLSTTLSCVDTVTFASLDIKVLQRVSLTQTEIDNSESAIYAQFPLDETVVRPYEMKFGKAKVSIIAPSVKIVRE